MPSVATSNISLDRILAAHLFGASEQALSIEMMPAAANWILSGVIADQAPDKGLAIIGADPNSVHLHAVGEEIATGFKLVEVYSDRVTIEGRGGRSSIKLPSYLLAASQILALSKAGSTSASATAKPQQIPAEIWHPAEGLIGVPLPAEIALEPQPHRDAKGRYNGIEVTSSDGWPSRLGLQRSDVITQIDGRAISNQGVARQALEKISSGSTVMVTIERDGGPMQVPLMMSENGG